jgi:hypothetical protein
VTETQIPIQKPSNIEFGILEYKLRTTENKLPQLNIIPEENENANDEVHQPN